MAYELEWTERASAEYEKLAIYLLSEWGIVIAARVCKEIDQQIIRIKIHPSISPFLEKRKNPSLRSLTSNFNLF